MFDRGCVEKIVEGGWGIVRSKQGVVFLNNVLPGEDVEYSIKEKSKNINWGRTEKITNPSDKRKESICPYYLKCGGCVFLHIDYDYQIKIKEKVFVENLRRIGGIDFEINEFVKSPPLKYRIRAKFKSRENGKIGFIQKGTNSVLPIKECLIVKPLISDFLKEWNAKSNLPFIFQFDVLENNKNLFVHLSHPPDEKSAEFIKSFQSSVAFSWKGNEEVSVSELKISDFTYLISPAVFFQVNHFLWAKMLEIVEGYLTKMEKAIDLYSGVGFFIPLLKKYANKVTAIESNGFSMDLAGKMFPDTKTLKGAAEKFTFPAANLILVDPPRSGLSKVVIQQILAMKYKKIIYISCNSASFSRDCKILIDEGGYQIKNLTLLDLFPQTPHQESIALFQA